MKVNVARVVLGIVWLVALYPGVMSVTSLFDVSEFPWSFGQLVNNSLPLLTLAWLIAVPVGIVCSLRQLRVGRLLLTSVAAVCMAVGIVIAGVMTFHGDYHWTASMAALVGIIVVGMGYCAVVLAQAPVRTREV